MRFPLGLDFAEDFVCDGNRVGTRAFGEAQRDRWFLWGRDPCPGRAVEHILGGFLRAIEDFRHFAEIDGLPTARSYDHMAHVFGGLQEGTGFDDDFLVAAGESSGCELAVGLLEEGNNAGNAEVAGGEAGRIEQDAELAA